MQGQKVCFTLKTARVAVQRMFQNWATLGHQPWRWGKGAGRPRAQLWLRCPCHGVRVGLRQAPSVRTGASHVGRASALGMWLAQVLRHFIAALCLLEPRPRDLSNGARGAAGPPGGEARGLVCYFLQHVHLCLAPHSCEMLPPGKAGDELLAAPVRLL